MRKTTIALSVLGILAVFFAGYSFAILTTSKEISSGANIITTVNLSVYDGQSATVELTFYDWGNLLPTQVKTKDVWVQNDAEIPLTISVSTKNWNPTYASESITLSFSEGVGWSGGMYPQLQPHQRASIVLRLSANDNPPSGAFSFVIVVSGMGG